MKFAKVFLASLASVSLLIAGVGFTFSSPVDAAYNTLPTKLPEDPPEPPRPRASGQPSGSGLSHQYINLTNDLQVETIPTDSYVKVYGAANNSKPVQIFFTDRGVGAEQACHNFLIDVAVSKDGNVFQNVATINPQPKSGENANCNNGRNFTIPAGSLSGPSNAPGKEGLYEGILRFAIKNVQPTSDTYKTPSFILKMISGTGRLGYPFGQHTNVYSSATGSSLQGSDCCGTKPGDRKAVHVLQEFFKPPCNYTGNERVRFKWADIDRGLGPQPAGTPTVTVREYNESNSYTGDANAGNLQYSGEPDIIGDPTAGGVSLDVRPYHKYEVRIAGVRGGNGIDLFYPFDSGNYDFDCPKPPPPAWHLTPNANANTQAGSYTPQYGQPSDSDAVKKTKYNNSVEAAKAGFRSAMITLGVNEKNGKTAPNGQHKWDVEYYYVRDSNNGGGGGDSRAICGLQRKNKDYTATVPGGGNAVFTTQSQVPQADSCGTRFLYSNLYFDGGDYDKVSHRTPRPNDAYCERLVRDFTPNGGNVADSPSAFTCVTLNGPPVCVPWTVIGSSTLNQDSSNSGDPSAAWVNDKYSLTYNFYNAGPAAQTGPISFSLNGGNNGSRTLGSWKPTYLLPGTIASNQGGKTLTYTMTYSPTKGCPDGGVGTLTNTVTVPYFYHIKPDITMSAPNVQQGDPIEPKPTYELPTIDQGDPFDRGVDPQPGRYHTWSDTTTTHLTEYIVDPDKPTPDGDIADNSPVYGCQYLQTKPNFNPDGSKCKDVYSKTLTHISPNIAPQDEFGVGSPYKKPDSETVKLPVGTKVCYIFGVSRPTHKTDPSIRWGNSKLACTTVVKKPKVQFQNSDVSVGRSFAGDGGGTTGAGCTAPASNTIETAGVPGYVAKNPKDFPLENGSIAQWMYGSWVEYGAFSTGNIIGFGTANVPEGLPNPYDDATKLAFANTSNPAGGFVYGAASCLPNFFALDKPSLEQAYSAALPANPDNSGRDVYTKDGNISLGSVGNVSGRDVIIHAKGACGSGKGDLTKDGTGNVEITGDIKYKNSGEPFATAVKIPRVIILADCNIVVDDSVTQVDAWLIAKGSVETCNTPLPDPPLNLTTKKCNKPIKFNGPVAANRFRLVRTGGSDLTVDDSNDPNARFKTAEVFDYRPDQIVSSYLRARNHGAVRSIYQIDLPPRY